MTRDAYRTCYCVTCDKRLNPLGVMGHRAMHRRKKERCVIETSDGARTTYYFDQHHYGAPWNIGEEQKP